jgi:hypothetical protein
MNGSLKPAIAVAERLCRPQRVGVFGHRGVGKTTLLTVLYREAVGGRLTDLRLAAADARTANYLADKIVQLEAGQPLPATLGETDLRFQLYHKGARLELLFKDYQGEHVELGRNEPIRDFLRDCDAVWLCLDAGGLTDPTARLRREQEAEQIVEDYLATDVAPGLHRPMGLLVTKADLLGTEGADVETLSANRFGMTRHALHAHAPQHGTFAVSSLGMRWPGAVEPRGLDAPLAWLASALQAQDEKRLDWLWSTVPGRVDLLERCVAAFARRYPGTKTAVEYAGRLRTLRRQRLRRRCFAGLGVAAALLLSLGSYDVYGQHAAERYEAEHREVPSAVLTNWRTYQKWHPTRALFQPGAARLEESHARELTEQARKKECEARLAELRRRGADPDADPDPVWQQFVSFHNDFPDANVDADVSALRDAVKIRRDEQLAQKAQRAHDELLSAEQHTSDLPVLLALTERFLRDHPGSGFESDVRHRRDLFLTRLDERDLEAARNYSAREPLNFQTRREQYQRYLDRHPDGTFRKQAEEALQAIERDWDRNDFRAVRDHYVSKPAEIPELVARCRSYLAIHPTGQFVGAANDLLRWSERVTERHEYKVTLRRGDFDHKINKWFTRSPDLSVELEVNGVLYGPSNIVVNHFDPEWNYEFSRPVKWKLGDKVVIRVTDHDYWKKMVVEIASADDDPLAMKLLSGEAASGPNRLTFESDFALPKLPPIE